MELSKIFENSIDEFEKRVLPQVYVSKGILLNEAFAICALANYVKCNVIIDSGTHLGRSAQIFAKYGFQLVYTLDRNLSERAFARLRNHNNICMIQGEDHDIIPNILKYHSGERVGLFLDSTKGRNACIFAKELKEQYPQLKMIALHDQCRQHLLKKYFPKSFCSDDEPFLSKYWYLNKRDIKVVKTITKYQPLLDGTFKGFVVGISI